ncbi:MAG: hypothetical protein ACI861_002490 [Paracoccaceae bacterium]|jgi:hypothetical protein
MRPILHGDVVASARALLAVDEAKRCRLMQRLISEASLADVYRRHRGRAHPMWGDGSLEVAASSHDLMPEPYLDEVDYCQCMCVVFEALIQWSKRSPVN